MTAASLTTSGPGVATGPAAEAPARWPRGVAFLTAVTAGGVTGLAFEPTNLWPLLFVGIAVWLVLMDLAPHRRKPTTTRARPLRSGFALGYGFGLGFYAVTLNWLSVLVAGVGPLLAMALICFEALFLGALGVAVRLVRRLPGWPLWVALCWGAMEFAQGRIPFGGFAWIRLTYSQVDSPLAGFLPFFSVSGVSVLAAGVGALLAWAYLRFQSGDRRTRRRLTIAVAASLVVVALLGQFARLYDTPVGEGTVTIGMVQGNVDGGSGIEAMGRARSVTNNHLSETVTLMAKARAGTVAMPDFVLWPENSTDIDPLLDTRTNATVAAAATLADRPILVGADDFEADDVIATLATDAGMPVDVVTGDRDLFQLVDDTAGVRIIYTARGMSNLQVVDEAYVQEKYGISARHYADFAAMRGDTSDGIPGVPGIGEKTAAALVNRYGGLDAIIEAALDSSSPMTAAQRKKFAAAPDYLAIALEVVRTRRDLSLETGIEELVLDPAGIDDTAFADLTEQLGLGSSAERIQEALG